MSNFDINVDRRTDGRKSGRLYRTLLQAGATKTKTKTKKNQKKQTPYMVYKTYKHKIQTNLFTSVTVHLKESVCEKVSLSSLSFKSMLDFTTRRSYAVVFSWCPGRAAVCDCGTPWTFLLPFYVLFPI